MKISLKYASGAGVIASLAPLAAKAQSDYNSGFTTTTADSTASAGLAIGLLIVWGIFFVIGIALFIFWIFMLVDVFKRTNWQDDGQKNLWMIVLIVSLFIGVSAIASIIYYFVVKRPLDKAGKTPPSAPQAPQAPPQTPQA
ncbi:MAG: hypothetical protein WCP56_02255 [Candidatus Saccharibacteria bacterium]